MHTHAVLDIHGKQFIVQKDDELIVQNLNSEKDTELDFPVIMYFDAQKVETEIGTPVLKSSAKAKVLESMKGTKIRVGKFKSKVRYRKVMGFRPQLTRIKIISI